MDFIEEAISSDREEEKLASHGSSSCIWTKYKLVYSSWSAHII